MTLIAPLAGRPVVDSSQELPAESCRPGSDHLLSVVVEDYFQVGAFRRWIEPSQWTRLESRLEANVDRCLELLAEYQTRATFFVLGWNARYFPQVMRRIAEQGHELACGGMLHRRLTDFTPESFREDVRLSRTLIEQAAGQRVLGYRLAEGWLGPQDHWPLDILADEGFAYDSSLLFRGWSWQYDQTQRRAHRIETAHGPLWEIPPSTVRFPWFDLPIAGGNYFRQIPRYLVRTLVSKAANDQRAPFSPLMLYFHVWELDLGQPHVTAAGKVHRVRHYRNLGKMRKILPGYLQQYRFGPVTSYLGHVDPEWMARFSMWSEFACEPEHPAVDRCVVRPIARAEASPVRSFNQAAALGCSSSIEPCRVTDEQHGILSDKTDLTGEIPSGEKIPVSIVVPCYNESQTLPFLSGTIDTVERELGDQYQVEFLFVDDGSADDTWSLLQLHFSQRSACRCLRHEVNQGITAAVLTGLKAATSEIVCSIDCDCSYDPLELKNMIPLLTDGVDLVTASPYHPAGSVRNVPGWRLTLSRGASWLYRRILGGNLYTFTSCVRVYRRSRIIDLPVQQHGFLGMAEVVGQLLMAGGHVVEYPTVLNVRLFGASKMKTLHTIRGHLGLMLQLLRRRFLSGLPPQTPQQATFMNNEGCPSENAAMNSAATRTRSGKMSSASRMPGQASSS